MNNIVTFNNQNIELIRHNGQSYMALPQIEGALEFAKKGKAISNLYNQHKSEFDEEMSCLIRRGNTRVRIFNREGAWLIGMFARTPKAAEFRRWVLKVLGNTVDNVYPCGMDSRVKHGNDVKGKEITGDKPVEVVAHTRSLPSGRKEIVLSEKAKAEIGGIVKNCLAAALEGKRPGMAKGGAGCMDVRDKSDNDNSLAGIGQKMTAEIDYNKLSAGVGGWVSMTLMSARYDDLKREAESLRRQAELCEKQAAETWKSVKKIESALGI